MNGPNEAPPAGVRPEPAPTEAAVCGLFCEACTLFIASHEDPARLALLAARWGLPESEIHCDGCRAERRSPYCRSCDLFSCAAERGHNFCSECADYPCSHLKEFQEERPHRIEILTDLERVARAGAEAWLAEVRRRYSCPSCGTLNSAYDLRCRSCGHEPSNDYVAAHREAILLAHSKQHSD
jgi:hypothetical protein